MLKGENIYLRALEPEDLELLYQAENDEQLWHVGELHQPLSKHTLQAYLANAHQTIEEAGQLRFAICSVDDELVGLIDLFEYDAVNQRSGVGVLVMRSYQKRGYATAALNRVKKYAREHLLLHQLHCQVHCANANSVELFKKCGFKISGTLANWQRTEEGFEDIYVLQCML